MSEEATQEGVSEGFGSNRINQISAIHEQRTAEREEGDGDETVEEAMGEIREQAESLDEALAEFDDGEIDEGGESEADGEAQSESGEQPADDDEPQSPLFMEGGQWMTRVKVDGEIRTLPFERLQAAAQKLEAGDQRLEQATRMQREIEQREQQLRQYEAQLNEQLPPKGADGQGQADSNGQEDVRELARQYHDALLNGEDDGTTNDLLARIATANRQQQPDVDVNRITEQVEQRVAQRQQEQDRERQEAERKATLETAFESFKSEFEDVAKDPNLMQTADQFTVTVANEHPTWTPLQVMREAGKRTQQWLAEKTGETSTQKRTQRKRNQKTASGSGARQPGKPEEKPKTRTDQLNEIRKARGQMPLG